MDWKPIFSFTLLFLGGLLAAPLSGQSPSVGKTTKTVRAVAKPDYRVQVRNGIGFAVFEFGESSSKNEIPILYFHGTSSSKLEPLVVLEQIKKLKRTVIAFDRPGYGNSTLVEFRSLNDYDRWAQAKLFPAVEKVLGYRPQKYDLVSVSGGALYSLHTARAMPQQVRKLSVLSAGLFARPVGGEGKYEKARRLAARRPRIAEMIVRAGKRNLDLTQSISSKKFSEPDRRFAECNKELAKKLYQDATKCGAMGIVQDARLQLCDTSYAQPVPKQVLVEFWNGACDNTVSNASAKLLAERVGMELNIIQNEGHLSSLPISFGQSVLGGGSVAKTLATTEK